MTNHNNLVAINDAIIKRKTIMRNQILAKPFIHNSEYYIYDTNADVILSVTKDIYYEIINIINNCIEIDDLDLTSVARKQIKSLYLKGFFKKGIVQKIANYYNDHIDNLLDSSMSYLQMQVTCDCNFMCRYCTFANTSKIDRTHRSQYMKWEVAKKALTFF